MTTRPTPSVSFRPASAEDVAAVPTLHEFLQRIGPLFGVYLLPHWRALGDIPHFEEENVNLRTLLAKQKPLGLDLNSRRLTFTGASGYQYIGVVYFPDWWPDDYCARYLQRENARRRGGKGAWVVEYLCDGTREGAVLTYLCFSKKEAEQVVLDTRVNIAAGVEIPFNP